MKLDELNRKWDEYDKAKAEFAKTHDSVLCDNCSCRIEPGEDICVDFDHVFCCETCALGYYRLRTVMFIAGDEDYETWFPEK